MKEALDDHGTHPYRTTKRQSLAQPVYRGRADTVRFLNDRIVCAGYYMLQAGTTETARTYAFAVLVFAELLRSFCARSETKPVWRISLFTNINLVVVVVISFGLQVWSQYNETLGRFLRTSNMPFSDCILLIALGAIPLLVLEIVKVIRTVGGQNKAPTKK